MKTMTFKFLSGVGLCLALSSAAFADYKCNVKFSLNDNRGPDTYFPDISWTLEVPEFRTSGRSRMGGTENYHGFKNFFGDAEMGDMFPSRTQNCMNEALDRVFPTHDAFTAIMDQIINMQPDTPSNTKGLYCTYPKRWEVGNNTLRGGLSFKVSGQRVVNRKAWKHQDIVISPYTSYCASYYDNPCPTESEEVTVVTADELSPDDIEDAWQGSGTSIDNSTEDNPTTPSGTPEPTTTTEVKEYCIPKPFTPIRPKEAWTEAGKSPLFPVDINGDFLSDIVMRSKDSNGQMLRIKLSNGDGTFSSVDYRSGEKFLDTYGVLAGYFNNDDKTDLLLRDRVGGTGMVFYSKLSNGDGTFSSVRHVDGDSNGTGPRIKFIGKAMVGDVDGDKLSDVVSLHRPIYGSRSIHISVKFSNGDGTFRSTVFDTGLANPSAVRYHLADINRDGKSDLVYTHASGHDLQIRSYISKGDGTFDRKDHNSGVWFNKEKFQSFVGDLNRDRRSDIVIVHRTPAGDLFANTYLGNGDGTFNNRSDHLSEDDSVDDFDAVVVDVNGDRRSDIVLRRRDANNNLLIITKTSNGDGSFGSSEFVSGDGVSVDKAPIFVGNYDRGYHADLGLRYTHASQGIKLRTKMGGSTTFTASPTEADLGSFSYPLSPITGPMRWNGGGTFNPLRAGSGTLTETATGQAVISNAVIGIEDVSGQIETSTVTSGSAGVAPAVKDFGAIKKRPVKMSPKQSLKRSSIKQIQQKKDLREPVGKEKDKE